MNNIRQTRYRVALCCALLFFLAVCSLTAGLFTPMGKNFLLARIVSATATPDFRLVLRGLDIGSTLTLRHMAIADAEGTWFEAKKISLRPQWRQLASGVLALGDLSAQAVHVHRVPHADNTSGNRLMSIPPLSARRIHLPHLYLHQPVVGLQTELAVHGLLTFSSAGGTGTFTISRPDAATDQLTIQGQLDANAARLEIRVRESAGGVLQHLLGFPNSQGARLHFLGHGPLSQWRADFRASLDDNALVLHGNATTDMVHRRQFSLAAQARLDPTTLSPPLAAMPTAPLRLEADGSWHGTRVTVHRALLTHDTGTIVGNATWEDARLDAAMYVQGHDLNWFMPSGVFAGAAKGEATLTINATTTKLHSTIACTEWTIGEHRLRTGRLQALVSRSGQSWQVETSGRCLIPTLPADFTEPIFKATISGRDNRITVHRVQIHGGPATLDITGRVENALHLEATLGLHDPTSAEGSPAEVNAILDGRLDLNVPTLDGQIALNATLPPKSSLLASACLGTNPKFDATLHLSAERIHLPQLHLRAPMHCTGQGIYRFAGRSLALDLDIIPPSPPHPFSSSNPPPTFSATFTGNPSSLSAQLRQTSGFFRASALDISNLSGTLDITDLTKHPHLNATARATSPAGPCTLELQSEFRDQTAHLHLARVCLPGLEGSLRGTIDPKRVTMRGHGTLSCPTLRPLAQFFGLDAAGQFAANIELNEHNNVQTITASVRGDDLALKGSTISRLEATGHLELTPLQWIVRNLNVDARVRDAQSAGIHLEQSHVSLDKNTTECLARVHVRDRASSTDANIRFALSRDKNVHLLRLFALDGHILRQPIRVNSPFELTLANKGLLWKNGDFQMGRARLRTAGRVDTIALDAKVALDAFTLEDFTFLFPRLPHGRLHAHARIAGTPAAPDIELHAAIPNLRVPGDNAILPECAVQTNATLKNHILHLDVGLDSGTDRDGPMATATLDCPLQFSLIPFAVNLSPPVPLFGDLRARLPLQLILQALHVDDQTLTGQALVDITMGGTLADPKLYGTATVRNAQYENFRTGTRLVNVNATLTARETRVDLLCTAKDTANGAISTTGRFHLDQSIYTAEIQAKNLHLLRQDMLHGTVSGQLTLTGNTHRVHAGGVLVLDPMHYRLPRVLPASLTEIDIQEVNAGTPPIKTPTPQPAFPATLDIHLQIPGRFLVQGRGLDSEWNGKLHLTGNATTPRINGNVSLRRGRFDFLDRIFTLTKGELNLNGATPPNPFLDIVGETQIHGTVTQVHLVGPAKNFRVLLSSDPVLPEDEILSFLLFGRSSRQISPLQALRLAQAAAELSGIGTTPDVLDALKRNLGLQEISVDKTQNGDTQVGLGGYVGGKYYVRTQRSVSGQDTTRVEIDVSPSISVETEVGADSRQGGKILWRHDY